MKPLLVRLEKQRGYWTANLTRIRNERHWNYSTLHRRDIVITCFIKKQKNRTWVFVFLSRSNRFSYAVYSGYTQEEKSYVKNTRWEKKSETNKLKPQNHVAPNTFYSEIEYTHLIHACLNCATPQIRNEMFNMYGISSRTRVAIS